MDKLRFRQVHQDFHTSPVIKGIGAAFDREEFRQALEAGHVDSITVFAKCHHGYSYHPTAVGEMHPGLDFDLLGAQLRVCEDAGVRAPVYISAGLDERYAVKHPECLVKFQPNQAHDFLNTAGYHLLCFNTPYMELLLAQTREVVEKYRPEEVFFDICDIRPCYCNYCLSSMRAKGYDPHNGADVMRHGREVYYRFAEQLREAVQRISPDTEVFFNAGRIPMDDRRFSSYDSHLELESLPTGGWGYDHFPMTALYSRALGKEYLGMTGKFHTTWGEFGGFKHPNALRYETALSLALGAKCSIGDQLHPSGKVNQATYRLIGKAYAEVEKKEEWCRDVVPVADAAILALKPPTGANRILLEKKYLYEIVDPYCDISKYKLVILPDNVPYSAELAEMLRDYLANGGKILASGVSCVDAEGRFAGLECLKVGKLRENRPDYMVPADTEGFTNGITEYLMDCECHEFTCSDAFRTVAYGADSYFNRTPEHFCSHRHTPNDPGSCFTGAVISDNIGYISWNIFEDYAKSGELHLKELVSLMLDKLLPEIDRSVRVKGLPDRGIVTLMEQPEKHRIVNHLLFAYTSLRGERTEIIEDIVPLYNVEAEVRTEHKIKAVVIEPYHIYLPFTQTWNTVRYTVPELSLHAMCVLEY